MSELTKQQITVCIDVGTETDVFRLSAADEILGLLVDAHETEFSIPELVDVTGAARSTVWRAVDLLDSLGVVRVRETPQRNYVSIDPERLQKDDPVLAIEQPAFHHPIRTFVERVRDAFDESDDINGLIGIVVFGSVARGEADRRSDIDLFVVVEANRMQAQREAHAIEQEIADEEFDGDRYEAHIVVEPKGSAANHDRIDDILAEGLTLRDSQALDAVKQEVFKNGSE